MRKSTEELETIGCRLPKRLVEWLDQINPGNRTHALREILEDAYGRDGLSGSGIDPLPQRKTSGDQETKPQKRWVCALAMTCRETVIGRAQTRCNLRPTEIRHRTCEKKH